MPDLETLIARLTSQGVSRSRIDSLEARLLTAMRDNERANYRMSLVALVLGLIGAVVLGYFIFLIASVLTGSHTTRELTPREFWLVYGIIVAGLTLLVAFVRPRSAYGIGYGPYTIADDPLFWREGQIGPWENLLRLLLALPNLLRMSLYNLLSVGFLRRVRENGELALFVMLAAESRIVAEEILLIRKKNTPHDLYAVVAALVRLDYLRYERLRKELMIWRGRLAEKTLGLVPDEER
jgi:hypothetical protein